ncbi:CDP-glycerol:poly(glycerophosphate) glycerophosphotransferase [Fictibacillus macauensis ZFHKF-1]|uniref:CDP-glycerol:poly(Glycerophosphate) glycerophosphotransferase n=1 Tax=Fictibacillus macauensis ZFHKF-1 TaxID=1196324 RepID=I8UJ43_9BACL|nr:CDP-glycerol--poly(glycerophosphate) glycerophosphotransferase [Fictibacillus macauensis]EIT86910.1 CDP-glycerol:poly(glycerophosphate) glycerophosphotransferase [Fictibacillus macauensis ZFHKF-1]
MVKELAVWLYLFYFNLQFTFFKSFGVKKDKIVFLVSFGDNARFVYEALSKVQPDSTIIFLAEKKAQATLQGMTKQPKIIRFNASLISLCKAAYHLATSKKVVVDNYFAILSSITFQKDVECIQLWHAAGAVKTFGLKDASVALRSKRAHQRFLNVYRNFHKVVVGSEAMAAVFSEAFGLPQERFLKTGVPRTDLFFNEPHMKAIKQALYKENPLLQQKKVILYAPTYRDDQLESFQLALDLDLLQKELGEEYVMLIRCHPVLQSALDLEARYPGFAFDYSLKPDVNELLLVTDLLISDYSSIPYEFSLLNKPMLFFPYDLGEYSKTRGLWDQYPNLVPGPIVTSTNEMITVIKEEAYNMTHIMKFSQKWNEYHHGKSSQRLAQYILETERVRH